MSFVVLIIRGFTPVDAVNGLIITPVEAVTVGATRWVGVMLIGAGVVAGAAAIGVTAVEAAAVVSVFLSLGMASNTISTAHSAPTRMINPRDIVNPNVGVLRREFK